MPKPSPNKQLPTSKIAKIREIRVEKHQLVHTHEMSVDHLRRLLSEIYDNVPDDVEIEAWYENQPSHSEDGPGDFAGINLTWYEDIEDGLPSDVASEPEVDVDRKARDRRRKRRAKDR
jgi:hypothetical protein